MTFFFRYQILNYSTLRMITQSVCQAATDWFVSNEMIVNPDKFQAIVVKMLRETIK